jgi:hypothetical protein
MTKQRKLILAVGVLAVAVVAVPLGLHVWGQRPGPGRFIDREHCDRIEKGMKQEDVEAIFGVPPGMYTKKQLLFWNTRAYEKFGSGERLELWTGDQGRAEVVFDDQNTVLSRNFAKGSERPKPSMLQQVLDWLRPSAPPPTTYYRRAPTPSKHAETSTSTP